MARIIITVIFLIAIAVLIILNIGSNAPVNVFGWKVQEMPVSVVAIVSFVAGVVYSFIFYLVSYIERGRRERLERKKKRLKSQEAELKSREQEVDELAAQSKKQMASAQKTQESASSALAASRSSGSSPGFLSKLFGRKQK